MTNLITAFFKAPWPDRDKERLEIMQSTASAIESNNKELDATVSAIAANNKNLTAAVDRMELALSRLKEKRQLK